LIADKNVRAPTVARPRGQTPFDFAQGRLRCPDIEDSLKSK
jgi:hypothetical protein